MLGYSESEIKDPESAIKDPVVVAQIMLNCVDRGQPQCVVYEPGNSTRYELCYSAIFGHPRFYRQLTCLNLGWTLPLREGKFSVHNFCTQPASTPGCWPAIRPVLAALGHADGEPKYNPFDRQWEAELRAHGYDASPLNRQDAKLGRLVRRAIEEEGN